MRINSVFLTTAVIGLLSCASVFAQHQGGTSGPDNSTYSNTSPVATVDTVLTHDLLQQDISDCMAVEALKIVRVLAKSNAIMPKTNYAYLMDAQNYITPPISPSTVAGRILMEYPYDGFGTETDPNSIAGSFSFYGCLASWYHKSQIYERIVADSCRSTSMKSLMQNGNLPLIVLMSYDI